ncbi:MAG: hypothetical protein ACREJQ_00115, partial [bacterium]
AQYRFNWRLDRRAKVYEFLERALAGLSGDPVVVTDDTGHLFANRIWNGEPGAFVWLGGSKDRHGAVLLTIEVHSTQSLDDHLNTFDQWRQAVQANYP